MGVDNTGALISQCGTEAGGYEGENGDERSSESGEPEARSISSGGLSVFFTARAPDSECNGGTGPAVNEVFARVGEPGPGTEVGGAVTVNVAGRTGCATSDSCDVTKAVKYRGASADGSKVFFTSDQPLVAGDTDSTSNLYECGGLPGDSAGSLQRMTMVNPCPDLVRVSVPVSVTGAVVQSVAAVSQDGSHVYFIAKGALAGVNAEGGSPTQGQDNLYVWEEPNSIHPQGHTAFIATLSTTAFALGEAQATTDGDSLVFTSSADLTPDDTSTVSQVFLYEASHEALIRVSRGQDGYNEDGNTTTDPASLTSGEDSTGEPQIDEGRRVISEDGSVVVFQSSAALTPQVHGGMRNVYLWRDGGVHLISDGTSAGSSGSSDAGLVGIDASGQNVFFTTEAPLVGQDSDELSDLYDARVDGGFPAPKVAECAGEACQGAFTGPLAPLSLGSSSPNAQGNLVQAPSVTPAVLPRPKPLTRSEKLAKALKACMKSQAKEKLAKCEAAARKRYGAKAKHKAKRKSRKPASGGGK